MNQEFIFKGPIIPFPFTDIASYTMENMLSRKDNIAFVDVKQDTKSEITFGELHDHIQKSATFLYKKGIQQGDVVAIYGLSSFRFFAASMAVLKIGGVVTTTASNLLSSEIVTQWSTNNVKLVFLDDFLVVNAEVAATELSLNNHHIEFIIFDATPLHSIPKLIGNYNNLVKSITKIEIPEIKINPNDLAIILHSSGSTGKPKAVAVSHIAAISSGAIFFGGRCLSEEGAATLVLWQMVFVAGFTISMFMVAKGFKTILVPNFDLGNVFRLVQFYKVEMMTSPPSIAELLVKTNEPQDFSSIKTVIFGGAIMGTSLENSLAEHLKKWNCHADIYQNYAMTEMIGILQTPLERKKRKIGSSGCVAANVELKLIGVDGIPVPANTYGEIVCKGPYRMIEYLRNPTATKEIIDDEGFLHTGDVAYYDDDGYFFIVDRVRDLIKYMGQQVSATELEVLVLKYGPVKECAVIGIRSEVEGELPTAVVVLEGNKKCTEEDIVQFVNSKVADHKKLRGGVIFIDQLPRSPLGKILRAELRQKYQNHQRFQVKRRSIFAEVSAQLEKKSKESAKQIVIDFILEIIALEIMGLRSVHDLEADHSTSLIAQGVNSSGAVLLRNALADSLSLTLPITTIFEHATLENLAEHLLTLLDGSSSTNNLMQQVQTDINLLQAEIDLSNTHPPLYPTPDNIKNILLTGATGFVGSHILAKLIQTTQATIHCVVRAQNDIAAHERVVKKMNEQQCWTLEASERVVAYAGNLSYANLGLPYSSLSFLDTIDSVYHVGAVVNWVLPYSQIRENVTGGVEIIKMIAKRGRKVPFHLISTIAALNSDVVHGGDKTAKGFGGYPLSKWASEQITLHARAQGLPVTIFRLPLVTPHAITGAANVTDELIRIILSCLDIGSIPTLPETSPHPIQAMAVNDLVEAVISLSFLNDTFQRHLVQFVTVEGSSWSDIFELLHETKKLTRVPLSQWSNHIFTLFPPSNI